MSYNSDNDKHQAGKNWPLALLLAVTVQGAGIVWWASAQEKTSIFLEQRVHELESVKQQGSNEQRLVIERLSRIEERVQAQNEMLRRIDQKIGN